MDKQDEGRKGGEALSMKQTMCEFVHGMKCDEVCKFLGEIVRCRDCKYSDAIKTRYQQETVYACLNFDSAAIEPDGFCAWGERREDD